MVICIKFFFSFLFCAILKRHATAKTHGLRMRNSLALTCAHRFGLMVVILCVSFSPPFSLSDRGKNQFRDPRNTPFRENGDLGGENGTYETFSRPNRVSFYCGFIFYRYFSFYSRRKSGNTVCAFSRLLRSGKSHVICATLMTHKILCYVPSFVRPSSVVHHYEK